MTNASRRIILFVLTFIVGLGLLAVLLVLFAQPPRPVKPSPPAITQTPRIVATVDNDPIHFDEWQRAVALDRVMSGFVGQRSLSPEETLSRLINERLVSRAAERAGIPEADKTQAESWLANFLAGWDLDEATFDPALTRVGLSRADLIGEIVPRLLQVEQALEELPPDGDDQVWVADLRYKARVVLLENLSDPLRLYVPDPTMALDTPSMQAPPQPTPQSVSLSSSPRVGELAPDFSLKAIDGTSVRLSDLRGRSVILNFWAPWCAPCRQELPLLQAISDDDLVVLGIAVREQPDTVTAFATDLGLEIPLLLDQTGQDSKAYQVHGLPTSLFVDREGVIVARHVGPLEQETLDSYVASLSAKRATLTPAP